MPSLQAIKKNPTDPIALIISAVGAILSAFGVWSTLGLTADQVGIVLTSLASVAAAIRGLAVARSGPVRRELELELETLRAQAEIGAHETP